MVSFDWTIIFQVVNFLVLLFILTKLLYKPLLKLLDERSKKIEDDINDAESMRKKAEETLEKYRKAMAEAQKEAQELKDEIRKNALTEQREIIANAKSEAENMISKAHKEIDQNISQAKQDLLKELMNYSVDISSKILEREINKDDHKKIIDEYITNLGGMN